MSENSDHAGEPLWFFVDVERAEAKPNGEFQPIQVACARRSTSPCDTVFAELSPKTSGPVTREALDELFAQIGREGMDEVLQRKAESDKG